VSLQGMMGSRALLVVDGGQPRGVAPGDSWQGVKVLSTAGDTAVVEIKGKRHTLRIGDSQVSIGGAGPVARGDKIVLSAGSGGHFLVAGTINGRAVQFMVDTGASLIGLSVSDAERFGVDYKNGQPVRMQTANGLVPGWRVKLASVRIGDVEIYDVDAAVGPQSMGPYVLLGNSFLSRFQMRRDNEQMVLERRF
jgi:aspartyl protease family protein